jgi:transposase
MALPSRNEGILEFFAGVDTHRDTHSIAIVNRLGELLESFTVAANSSGYAEALAQTAKYAGLIWGLEGTGSYGRPFADNLIRQGHTVYEVPGVITKRHRRRLRRRGKSDPQDAHAIAEAVLRERDSLPRHLEADAEEATRLLYDRRDRYVRERTAKVNRTRALALRLELELPDDLTTMRALDTAEAALKDRRTYGYADYEAVDEIRDLLGDLRRILERIAEVESRTGPFVERLAPELLKMRGCSVISAAGLIGNTGQTINYRSSDAFASHAGAAPVSCSSGKHESVRLNTGGNRQLNRCLHNIANVQMRTIGHVGKLYYDRKRAEGKTHREAMRCLKRRLAAVVFRTLRTAQARRQNPSTPNLALAIA